MSARHGLLLCALLAAAGLAVFGDKSSDNDLLAAPRPALSVAQSAPTGVLAGLSHDDPEPVPVVNILSVQTRVAAVAVSKSLFASVAAATAKPAAQTVSAVAAPVAPPLPFTYLGKQNRGGKIEVYLARGDEVIVAREQSVIQNTYRVQSISAQSLSLMYLPLQQVQQISIGAIN